MPSNIRAVSMARTKAAARSRRVDRLPGLALNLEVLGIALFCAAIVLALSLLLPHGKSGSVGALANATLHTWFGAGAWIAIFALATVAAIIFLEIRVLPKMAALAGCAAAAFFALDGLLGMSARGGHVGNLLARGFTSLFGAPGADVVLTGAFVGCAVVATGISLKRTLGTLAFVTAKATSSAVAQARVAAAATVEYSQRARRLRSLNGEAEQSPAAPADELVLPAPVEGAPFEPRIELELPPEVPAPAEAAVVIAQPEMPESSRPPVLVEPAWARLRAKSPSQLERGYRLPDFALFNPPEKRAQSETSAAVMLEETLASFGVNAKVTHIERGPSVTRYELTPAKGVKVSAIKSLENDLQRALAAQAIRIEAPIPGKAAVGVEVPNSAVSIVAIREILDFLPRAGPPLPIGLGKDITGRPITTDLNRMPHLLVAGATGAGKSVCLNVIIASLLATRTPDEVQLLLIDVKRVEFAEYNGVPHLIAECITDPKLAAGALYELTKEMDARYERFAHAGVRKIEEYNLKYPGEQLPYIVVAIDELADLMLVAPTRVETSICRIAQLARATGIHLVVATQRPSVDVITGLIKANIPSRIAFAVSSQVDSRTILDMAGAERLLGCGDMLFLPIDAPRPIRIQGALVTGPEIERLCEFWREQEEPDNRTLIAPTEVEDDGGAPSDELAFDAAKVIIERQFASVALLQAELKVGHPRAVRIMKILEQHRVVGPTEGTKPRKILMGTADMDRLATILAPRGSEPTLF